MESPTFFAKAKSTDVSLIDAIFQCTGWSFLIWFWTLMRSLFGFSLSLYFTWKFWKQTPSCITKCVPVIFFKKIQSYCKYLPIPTSNAGGSFTYNLEIAENLVPEKRKIRKRSFRILPLSVQTSIKTTTKKLTWKIKLFKRIPSWRPLVMPRQFEMTTRLDL